MKLKSHVLKVISLFVTQALTDSKIFTFEVIVYLEHVCLTFTMIPSDCKYINIDQQHILHVCVSHRCFRDTYFANAWPRKGRSRSRSTTFAMALIDDKISRVVQSKNTKAKLFGRNSDGVTKTKIIEFSLVFLVKMKVEDVDYFA